MSKEAKIFCLRKKPTTARRALELVREGKAEHESVDHADPFTDARVSYARILKTGWRRFIPFLREENVCLGEFRPKTGTAVVSGSLREERSDTFSCYENTRME